MGTIKIVSEDGDLIYDEESEISKQRELKKSENDICSIHESVYDKLDDLSSYLNHFIFNKNYSTDKDLIKHRIHLLKSDLYLLESKFDELLKLRMEVNNGGDI